MSALGHITAYLKAHFANHDIETLMTHFETAIEAKVEEGLADLKQEIAELRNEVIPPMTPAKTGDVEAAPADPAPIPPEKAAAIAELPPIAQPDAIVEAQENAK